MQSKLLNILNLNLENYDFTESLKKFLIELAEKYDPALVILMGSLAKGDYWRDSDVDLLVVLREDRINPVEKGIEIRRSVYYDFALDLFVYGRAQFENMLGYGNLVALDAMEYGKVLYVGDEEYKSRIDNLWHDVRKRWTPTEYGWKGIDVDNENDQGGS